MPTASVGKAAEQAKTLWQTCTGFICLVLEVGPGVGILTPVCGGAGQVGLRPAVARSFHVSAPARTSFEDSRIARPHCHHASLWKIWKPLSANGSLMSGEGDWAGGIVGLERNYQVVEELTAECEYLLQVLNSMPASAYKDAMLAKTEHKLGVLKSGKSEDEMKEALAFGELEEVHAAVRGELELIKALGKEWFTTVCSLSRARMRACSLLPPSTSKFRCALLDHFNHTSCDDRDRCDLKLADLSVNVSQPHPNCPPEETIRFSQKAGE